MADTPAAKALLNAIYLTMRLLLSPFRQLLWFLCITVGTIFMQCSDLVAFTKKKYHHKQYVRYRVPPLTAPYYPRSVSVDHYYLSDMLARGRRKVLVLDLDETLIHSYHDAGIMKLQRPPYPPDFTFRVLIDRHHVRFNVHKRPHVDFFLNVVKHWFDLVVFTASMEVYGSAVADRLGQEFFMKRLYRQHCSTSPSCGGLTKNLSIICADLSSIMIIDNSPLAYKDFTANAIPITSWYYDPSDTELLALLPVLDALRFVNDVRTVLGRKNRSSCNNMSNGSNVLLFGTHNPAANQLVIRADPNDGTVSPDIIRSFDNKSNGETSGVSNHKLSVRALAAGAV